MEPRPINRADQRRLIDQKARKEFVRQQNALGRRKITWGIIGGLTTLATGTGVLSLAKFAADPLQELVAEASSRENNFQEKDLSDPTIRQEHTRLMAQIFVRLHPSRFTPDDLANAVNFDYPHQLYTSRFSQPTTDIREYTGAVISNGRIYIDQEHQYFQASGIKKLAIPRWTPLGSLRTTLTGQFFGLIPIPNFDDPFTPDGTPLIGFRPEGVDSKIAPTLARLEIITCELLSAELNKGLFPRHNFYNSPVNTQAQLIEGTKRLQRIVEAANLNPTRLAQYHTNSQLSKLLIFLAGQGEQSTYNPSAARNYGLKLIENAVVGTDNQLLEEYISKAKRNN